jgi:hypothetical protein
MGATPPPPPLLSPHTHWQLGHVSLGVTSGRQAMREAIRKFSEAPDVSHTRSLARAACRAGTRARARDRRWCRCHVF